ncbi:MAG: hypothetical protein Faunusvirus1_30 [Faunusvirus sp.]|jgi:hypothetical protein|uniref:Uncharacterized protein n=1 Tax=Faunusvirus sp. TaxID=2487766 RepID=A0A3G4ZVY3_9VIRU|nr:MAG: hypothetical protein Faunusvirus1_30 [Faunusvirus sp.]
MTNRVLYLTRSSDKYTKYVKTNLRESYTSYNITIHLKELFGDLTRCDNIAKYTRCIVDDVVSQHRDSENMSLISHHNMNKKIKPLIITIDDNLHCDYIIAEFHNQLDKYPVIRNNDKTLCNMIDKYIYEFEYENHKPKIDRINKQFIAHIAVIWNG